MRELLDLPERSGKPRERGVTHVIDRGLSIAEIEGLVEVAGEFVDIVKLGWGTALATGNLDRKLERYRAHGDPGRARRHADRAGHRRGRLDGLIAWLHELGLEHFEISDGTITIEHERKLELIERLAQEFTVLSEVGSKDDTARSWPPYRWVEQIAGRARRGRLEGDRRGAARAGSVGIFRHDGEVRRA